MFSADGLEFDGYFEVGLHVETLVDLTKRPLVDFSDDVDVFSNFLKHLRHGLISVWNKVFKITIINHRAAILDKP
jgi:hypothetical protein